MTGCSMAAKRMGNDLITGKQKIGDISNSMKTATASTKALGVAMNVFANVGFMLAITAISKVVSELAQAQENAVQAAKEATETYNDEISSIDDYKTRLSELHEELNSGNLSYEETKTKRTELMSIQDELIEKFGTEKGAIESVTEAINGQVDALDTLNEKSYRDWVAKADEQTFWNQLLPGGKSGLDQAIDYMETDQTVSFYDMQNANLSEELQAIQKEIDKTIKSKYNLDKTFATFNVTGTPEEIKSQLEAIRQDYLDLSKDAFLENGISSEMWEKYRKEAIDSLNEVINKFDDGLEKHQETYQTYFEGMIKYDSEYSDEYATILQKRAELESAQNSGNKEAIQKARQEFMDAINKGISESGSNENIKKYFESLYPELQSEFSSWNFEIALSANTDGLTDVANEIGEQYTAVDLLDMVNTEGIQEGEESFNTLIDKAYEYGVITDKSAQEVQKLIDLLVALGYVKDNVKSETFKITVFSDFFSLKDAENATTKLGELSDQLDKIQSAYKNLKDTMDSYSSTGTITIDQFQSIVEQGSKFLDYLTLEDGQLSLNEQAMYDLAEARIIEMKAQMVQGIIDNVEKINTEADADLYLASTNYELAESYHALAEAQLTAWYSSSTLSKDTKDEVIAKARNDIAKINKLVTSVNLGSIGGSSTKDAEKSAKEYVDSYMEFMKSSLETNRIDFKTYSNDVSVFLKRMFDEGKISGEEYFDYVQKQLETEKKIMDAVISAVTYRIDEEVSRLKSEQDAIQDTIDSLREANDEKERAMKLDKARWELMRLQSQRTIKLYTEDKGIIYTNDHTSIREVQENLENLEFEEVINGLEKEKDALGDSIEELERYKDKWNNIQKQHEINLNKMHANDILGQKWEKDVLSGRIDTLNNFANNYFNIQKAIADAAWNSANEQIKAAEAAQRAQNTYVTPNVPNETPSSNDYWVYQTLASEDNSGLASSKIGYLGGDGVIKVGEKYLVIKWKKGFTTSGEASSQIGMLGGSGVYKRYHTGLDEGYVGDKTPLSKDKRLDVLQKAGNGDLLKSDEQLSILKNDELVLTKYQGINIADTLWQKAMMPNITLPNYNWDNMVLRNNTPSQTVNIGDIHLHEVQNVPDFAKALQKHLPNISVQYNGKH